MHATETPHAKILGSEVLELVAVRSKVPLVLGDRRIEAGEEFMLPWHRAEYARFLGLVEWGG